MGPRHEHRNVDRVEDKDICTELSTNHRISAKPQCAVCDDMQMSIPEMTDIGDGRPISTIDCHLPHICLILQQQIPLAACRFSENRKVESIYLQRYNSSLVQHMQITSNNGMSPMIARKCLNILGTVSAIQSNKHYIMHFMMLLHDWNWC
jgi:hypothetical protein